MIGDIPSPSSGVLELGPLSIHAYGLMIALGVVAAVWLGGRRLEQKGVGTREDMSAIALWAVPAGVIGARLYHVATDWQLFEHDFAKVFQIWKGGLGIPGGILAGTVVGLWRGHRRGIHPAVLADAVAPAMPLAQAIGRWGNYFNQELFGKPTDLPWGLEVSDDKTLAAGYQPGTTFHPTFLYESLWNLAIVAALLLIDRRFTVRRGSLFAMYIVGYGIGRFWVEGLRIDPAHEIGGLRFNQWVALVLVVAGIAYLLFVSGRPVKERPLLAAGTAFDDDVDLADADAAEADAAEADAAEAEGVVLDREPADADGAAVEPTAHGEADAAGPTPPVDEVADPSESDEGGDRHYVAEDG